jgi:hypothetical protein
MVGPPPAWATARLGRASLLRSPGAWDLLHGRGLVPSLLALAAVAGAAGLAWRARHQPRTSALLVVALAGIVPGALLLARVPRGVFSVLALHNHLWFWPITAFLWVGLLVAPGRHRPLAAAALAVAVGFALVSPAPGWPSPLAEAVPTLADQLDGRLDPDGRYLVELRTGLEPAAVGVGLVLELERRGYDLVVDARLAAGLGDHRAVGDEPVDGTLLVGASIGRGAPADALARRPPDPAALRRLAEARGALGPVGGEIDDVVGAYAFNLLPELDDLDVRRLRTAEGGAVSDVWVTLVRRR